ncbi:hypothetical protein D3C72_1865270 [compost metagenome]
MPTLRFRQKVVHKLNNSGMIARPKTVIHPHNDENDPDRRGRSRPPGDLAALHQQHVPWLPFDLLHPAGGGEDQGSDPYRRGRRVRERRTAEEYRQAPAEGRHHRTLQPEVGDLHPDPDEQ